MLNTTTGEPQMPDQPTIALDVEPTCPNCGSDDLGTWAEDGESPEADYWECENCKHGGRIAADHALIDEGAR